MDRVVRIEGLLTMDLEDLVEVEITLATGTAKPLRLAPAIATVITAEDIERMGATTLDEVLDTVPGLHTASSGLNRFDPIYSIRGVHTKTNPQILFLVNGLPFKALFEGFRMPTSRVPVAMISRGEVIRGPGSALHGADALSGLINVVTKDAREIDGTRMGVRYGSFDTSDIWVQHGGIYSGFDNHVLRLGLGSRFEGISTDEEKNFGHGGPAGALLNVQGTPYIFYTDHDRRIIYALVQDE